jgi:predicted Zn finger-like uncharacterized protein
MIISCPACGASFNIKAEALGPNGRTVKCSKCAHRWRATADEDAQDAGAPAASNAESRPAAAEPATDAAGNAAENTAQDTTGEAASDAESGTEAVPETGDGGAAESGDAAETTPDGDGPETSGPPPGLQDALGLKTDDDEDAGDEKDKRRSRSGSRPKPVPRKPRRNVAKVLSFFVLLLLISGVGGAAVFLNQKIMMWLPATQRLYALVGIEPQVLGHGLQIVEPKPKKEIDGNDEILVVEGEIKNTTGETIDIPLMRGALLDKQGQELHIWTFTAAKSRIAPGEFAQYRTEFRNPPPLAESLDITFTRSNAVLEAASHAVNLEKKPEAAAEHGSAKSH